MAGRLPNDLKAIKAARGAAPILEPASSSDPRARENYIPPIICYPVIDSEPESDRPIEVDLATAIQTRLAQLAILQNENENENETSKENNSKKDKATQTDLISDHKLAITALHDRDSEDEYSEQDFDDMASQVSYTARSSYSQLER